MQKQGPENIFTRIPLVNQLVSLGWDAKQLRTSPEWRIPKRPSEAAKREAGNKFEAYPVDLVIFDDINNIDDWEHVKIIFETKKPDVEAGLSQLEIYLSLEPRAIAGYWTNGSEISALFRTADGKFKRLDNASLPRPSENLLLPSEKPITWTDFQSPTEAELKRTFKRLLDNVVSSDTKSTRRDDQLNQLCNLLLIKLESDKKAKAAPEKAAVFQVQENEHKTATTIRNFFDNIKITHTDLFFSISDQAINLDDATIHLVAYELGKLKLLDTSIDSLSTAFQVLRSESLKSEEGQYFTPIPVIRSCVELMDVDYDDKIIDPACGSGAFLLECFKQFKNKYPHIDEGDAKAWAQRHLYGVDKDQINVKLTKAMLIILGDGSTHTYLGDSIRSHLWPKYWPNLQTALRDQSFTCIVTNPPFGKNLKITDRDGEKAGLTISKNVETNEYSSIEIGLAFLDRCHSLLVPGGRLGIILPETYFFSKSYLWLQQWIEKRFVVRGIVNIPMEAFQGFCRAKTNFYVFEKRENET
jgi:type I restriction-modification system DNA methylase subunit